MPVFGYRTCNHGSCLHRCLGPAAAIAHRVCCGVLIPVAPEAPYVGCSLHQARLASVDGASAPKVGYATTLEAEAVAARVLGAGGWQVRGSCHLLSHGIAASCPSRLAYQPAWHLINAMHV